MMLTNWWLERTQRERYIISIGGAIATVLIVYVLIWEPLTAHIANLRQDVLQDNALLSWMDSAASRIDQFRKQGYTRKQPSTQALLVTVEQSLMQSKLSQYVANTQQQSNQQINLALKNVPFDRMMDWIETLWKVNNITVTNLAATNTRTTGVVTASITLQR